ncbi:hypothetical protein BRC79_10970 [Halobacteriales archaeon QH_8_67_27]|nr:MAG: hypothetical protein BRC79_10970 [Halobacteriales archaeon QH_8_67_27]
MSGPGSIRARLRQPEYTGENRCLPCTVLNVAVAAVGTTLLVAWLTAAGYATAGLALGAVVLGVSLAAIWLRGYLVPGTPTLTKRYLPEPVLAAFGKAPAESPEGIEAGVSETARADEAVTDSTATADGDPASLDVEALLERAEAIEPCRGDDRCLTEEFEQAWREEAETVRDAEDLGPWFERLGLKDGDVTTNDLGGSFAVNVDGHLVGTWESRPSFHADLAAGALVDDRLAEWDALSARARGQVCNGLRIFLETCPGCGGPVSFGTETVESCCSSRTVAAVTCDDCGARVFESPVDEDGAAT